MIRFPHAKINLGLQVLGERSDGYHEIRSILYPIGLCDLIELIPGREGKEAALSVSGDPTHEGNENDLILRAYRALPKSPERAPRIQLHKRIPAGAGLGGGSSDAGQVLRHYATNEGCDPFDPDDLYSRAAAAIGSDVPFFLQDRPVLVSGRGERMAPADLDLGGLHLLLLVPPFRSSTGAVYRNLACPEDPDRKELDPGSLTETPVNEWKEYLENDLESPAFQLYPELGTLKEKLYEAGAMYAAMSGSGSGVFGLFEGPPPAIRRTDDHFRWTEELPSLTSGPGSRSTER
jgi:4-diphosphocytidyl-2-C-methyl-D-erythritol kinase